MNFFKSRKRTRLILVLGSLIGACLATIMWLFWPSPTQMPMSFVSTQAGTNSEFGEPFGVAAKSGEIFVSDGQNGKIWHVSNSTAAVFADGLDTPSAIVFDRSGQLVVADSGSHTIRAVDANGTVSIIAGVEGQSGFADGQTATALFNGPIGITASPDGKIFVADTYNDRIRIIENGKVSTLAGSSTGFAEGLGAEAKFHTPCGLAIWNDKLLVADAGNRRIRVVESNGQVWTLAGNGEGDLKDGLLLSSSFVQPMAVTVDNKNVIYVADGNAIRQIGGTAIPIVRTISDQGRGIKDGIAARARFNRPSGLAIDADGRLLVADSENRLLRFFSSSTVGHNITKEEIASIREKSDEFRSLQPARWPYDPPNEKRDIAGTLGEIRGEMKPGNDQVWFHNGLDIAGAYGETARFVRDEKVLRPAAAENFGTLRELIRMPTLGYIHIRLGRNVTSDPFGDARFQFVRNSAGKLIGVRVPRGAKFNAGEPVGTLNPMNHVHLVAGRSGSEMNALNTLTLPNLTDSRPPVIEKVTLFDENWNEIETAAKDSRIKLAGKTRIVVRAYDQTDGNSDRRRLGVYRIGYQILRPDDSPVTDAKWTIIFDRLPLPESISLVYANGSRSGATGETVFNYIATNSVDADVFQENFFDPSSLPAGQFVLRVFAADFSGNQSFADMKFSVE